eukprot:6505340-Prymnesium_polylepis.1
MASSTMLDKLEHIYVALGGVAYESESQAIIRVQNGCTDPRVASGAPISAVRPSAVRQRCAHQR